MKTLIADKIAEVNSSVSSIAAADVPITDAGNYTSTSNVEAALQEIYGRLSNATAGIFPGAKE